jgi:uncharacterized protein YbcI
VTDEVEIVARTVEERQLGEELLRIHQESYGRTAGSARVHILDHAVLCFFDDLELLPNEQFLVDAGRGDAVVDIRTQYQAAIETTFGAAVERVTGRRVTSFISATKLSPNYALEVFRLGPAKDPSTEVTA